jgi:hypothetical protein
MKSEHDGGGSEPGITGNESRMSGFRGIAGRLTGRFKESGSSDERRPGRHIGRKEEADYVKASEPDETTYDIPKQSTVDRETEEVTRETPSTSKEVATISEKNPESEEQSDPFLSMRNSTISFLDGFAAHGIDEEETRQGFVNTSTHDGSHRFHIFTQRDPDREYGVVDISWLDKAGQKFGQVRFSEDVPRTGIVHRSDLMGSQDNNWHRFVYDWETRTAGHGLDNIVDEYGLPMDRREQVELAEQLKDSSYDHDQTVRAMQEINYTEVDEEEDPGF